MCAGNLWYSLHMWNGVHWWHSVAHRTKLKEIVHDRCCIALLWSIREGKVDKHQKIVCVLTSVQVVFMCLQRAVTGFITHLPLTVPQSGITYPTNQRVWFFFFKRIFRPMGKTIIIIIKTKRKKKKKRSLTNTQLQAFFSNFQKSLYLLPPVQKNNL